MCLQLQFEVWTVVTLLVQIGRIHAGAAENIALRKTAYQSSTLHTYEAWMALDGNYNTNLDDGQSCTHTLNDNNPWWAVDLGSRMEVQTVILTNRGNCCGDRLRAVQIGTTDVSPLQSAPALTNYNLCSYFPGAVALGASQSLTCGTSGRFVVVQLNTTEQMTLCEVEVHGIPAKELSKCEKEKQDNPLKTCTSSGDYEKKQCNAEQCWCADATSGQSLFCNLKFPIGETFTCDRKPRKCERKRFKAFVAKSAYIPTCNDKGNFMKMQCIEADGEKICFCVRTSSGKKIKGTQATGTTTC